MLKNKRSNDISLSSYLLVLLGNILSIIYSIIDVNLKLWFFIQGVVNFLLTLWIIVLWFKYRNEADQS